MFLRDDELEEFKKTETFKMLIKGTYLGVVENDLKNMTKKQLVDWCFKRESEIFDLNERIALTEKALELACDCFYNNFGKTLEPYCECNTSSEAMQKHFKTKAKEMMKSE